MADTTRIVDLTEASALTADMSFVVDSSTSGTKKIPVPSVIDDTLSVTNKMADALAVGQALAQKANTSDLPTKVSDLDNDTGFQTATQVNAAVTGNVDDTLSTSGKAADAKKTGDEITALKSDLTAEETARQNADTALQESVTELSETMEADYAKNNGSYDDLTAGTAKQLESSNYVMDSEPYHYRKSGGGKEVGTRRYDDIIGGTVCWNQFYDTGYVKNLTINGIAFTVQADGSILVDGTATGNTYYAITKEVYALNHVLFFAGCPDGGSKNTYRIYLDGHGVYSYDVGNGSVFRQTADEKRAFIYVTPGTTVESKVFKPQFFDLTQMFGSTIADRIYDLERNSEGAGVAYFRKYFPNEYYEYNPGELMSVSNLISHDSVGFNIWDEEWELGTILHSTGKNVSVINKIRSKNYIPVVPSAVYHLHVGSTSTDTDYIYFYDANKMFVGNNYAEHLVTWDWNFTVPDNAHYMRFVVKNTTYNHDICINLSDPDKNGIYEPYEHHSYPLDSTLTLRGIPKLDESNNLYYDGDTYEPDGKVTRKYGIVDLGTLSWTVTSSNDTRKVFGSNVISDIKAISAVNIVPNLIISRFVSVSIGTSWTAGQISMTSTGIQAVSCITGPTEYSDATAFKEAMSGVMLVYELATPTIETAESYQSPQVVDPYGTEEYVTTSIVPVGHNTKYPEDIVRKIDSLPSNFATLIAPTEKAYKATRNYVTGNLFIVNNILYKATANIANGGTITPNSNCTATTLAEIISAL